MSIYSLYVKTHRKTGLKYLGKTNQDPHKYPGSGVYWSDHLKKHGNDVATEILHECQTNDEIRELGLHYSALWDIVNAVDEHGRKIWANLKPEEGDGGWGGDQNPNNMPHVKEAQRQRGITNNPIHLPGVKEKVQQRTLEAMAEPTIRKKHLDAIHSDSWMTARAARVADKAPNFDATIYTWQHKDGTVIHCTQYDLYQMYKGVNASRLIKGKIKTSKGWRLVKS
jgi:hypothetical protein